MPIRPEELIFKYSTAIGPGHTATGSSSTSLGGFISTTQVPPTMNNIFDNITGPENAAGQIDYRCVFLHNASAQNLPLQNAVLWIAVKDAYGAAIALGVDPTGPTPISQADYQSVQIATPTTAPAGVTFSTALSQQTGIAIGTINAGEAIAFWYQRTARNTSALDQDSVSVQVQGTSLF